MTSEESPKHVVTVIQDLARREEATTDQLGMAQDLLDTISNYQPPVEPETTTD